ncbi:MAG: hypothetical protein WBG18_26355 [Xanthobacteraceae bacterium]
MSDERDNEERPCLHCMMVELIDQFFAENPATADEPNTIDTDEVIAAVAKTVAELTCSQDGTGRQQIIAEAHWHRGAAIHRATRRVRAIEGD